MEEKWLVEKFCSVLAGEEPGPGPEWTPDAWQCGALERVIEILGGEDGPDRVDAGSGA